MMPVERLRRLVGKADRRLRAHPRAVGAALAVLGVAVLAALGAAAWPILEELRAERAAAADSAPAYVKRVQARLVDTATRALKGGPSRGWSGTVSLRIVIGPDGTVRALEPVGASPSPEMEAFARQVVREAAPFEPFPPDLRRRLPAIELTNQFVFK